ncbi:flagellar hook protein FlgE [Campylobacter coli]|nr:flagellar hook protein FlgE [Campylobacter coli]
MMRSLWSGVSGLQAHQVAMDVEGNNISNVNTTGFKYSRADFGTMFSQTVKIATAPTDGRGGSNPLQIGLGVSVSSTTRIHSQGSVQTTDKNTDVAINGDGFFMVSDDGGLTNYLTRSGDFKLDAYGNFVNNAGFVVQGWNINWDDQTIDSSRSPKNIFIDPGMHIPAAKSTEVAIKANLNSGLNIGTSSTNLYGLDSVHGYNTKTNKAEDENDTGTTQFYTTSKNSVEVTEKGVDAGSLFNASGTGLNLRDGQGFWVSYADAKYTINTTGTAFDENNKQAQNNVIFWGNKDNKVILDITINGVHIQNQEIQSLDDAIAYINTFTAPTDTRDGTGVKAVKKADGTGFELVNDNADGTTDNMKNIDLVVGRNNSAGELHNLAYTVAAGTDKFTATLQKGNGDSNWIAGNQTGGATTERVQVITAHKYIYSSSPINLPPMYNPDGGPGYTPNAGNNNQRPTDPASANYWDALHGGLMNTDARVFRTTEDLRELLQRDARYGVDYNGSGKGDGTTVDVNDINQSVKVVVNSSGHFAISNANEDSTVPAGAGVNGGAAQSIAAKNMSFNITAYSNKEGTVSTNDAFTAIFKAWDGPLVTGGSIKESEQLKLSAFSAGLEIYDSLGSKHTLEVQFVKQSTTQDGGNEWQMIIRVPEPAEINTTGEGPTNIIVGSARFNNDGSLASYTPKTISFSPNNGAAPNQQIKLSFGTSGSNDGLVSSNSASTLTGQATDGYTSGNLKPDAIRVDDKGNILGEFTNGKTFAVAKIAMASVANNSGLEEIGGNLFKITANSGNIVVGEAGTGGRGEMKTAALEMSNVDLSRSLTELIIIQRGYQANSKTISTSDQMLQTLIQLKQ